MLKSHTVYDPLRNLYVATLLGGEFHNTHGHGETVEQAQISLKIRYKQMQQKQATFTKYNPGKNAYIAWATYQNKNLFSIVMVWPYYEGGVYIEKYFCHKTKSFVSDINFAYLPKPDGELKMVEVNSELGKEVELAMTL